MTSSDNSRANNSGSAGKSPAAAQASLADDSSSAASTQDAQRPDIRQALRKRRDSLPDATVAENSRLIACQLMPLLRDVRHIAGYLSFGNEVSVEALLADCRARHSTTYVPLVQPDHTLLFSPLDEHTQILENKYGIREPVPASRDCILPMALDAVLVPLLGFDPQCNRMGMGGGYYDRSFACRRHATSSPESGVPLLIGVAHELQCVDSLTTQWWDVPLDLVVTESRIYRRNSE